MDIKHLRAFLAVADAKSFLKAADDLYISRQAISKTIDQLESELHLELFLRSQKGAMMTPAGIFLYPRAATLVAEFDKLMQDTMDVHRSYRPVIKIAISLGIFGQYAKKLNEYGEKYSAEMDLQVRSCLDSECNTLLSDRRADAIISFSEPNRNIARTTILTRLPVVFLVNRNNSLLRSYSAEALRGAPLLLYTGGHDTCPWWPAAPRKEDFFCSDLNYLLGLLREDQGIMPIPELLIPDFLDFTEILPARELLPPACVYYSTLHPDHYTSMNFSLLDALYSDVIELKR